MFRWLPLVLLIAASVHAESDLSFTFTPAKTTIVTGERLRAIATVKNNAATEAHDVLVQLNPGRVQFITADNPPGWSCFDTEPAVPHVSCTTPRLAPGATVQIGVTIAAVNETQPLQIAAGVSSNERDRNPADDNVEVTVNVVAAPRIVDLAIDATNSDPVAPCTRGAINFLVRNHGPESAQNLFLRARYVHEQRSPAIEGEGWTCNADLTCTRASLAAGATSLLTLSFDATTHFNYEASAQVGAELSLDPQPANNTRFLSVIGGDAQSWRRILLPVALEETPGANGSLWKTEITTFDDDGKPVELRPCAEGCDVPAVFVWVHPIDEPDTRINLRVRDITRAALTFGTDVPILRERDFSIAPITLGPIPVDSAFRTTLRVYDLVNDERARVAISLFADEETTPRIVFGKAFTHSRAEAVGGRPKHPGYLQMDPVAEAGERLAGATMVRIRVAFTGYPYRNWPLWALATVTNNETREVTTLAPR